MKLSRFIVSLLSIGLITACSHSENTSESFKAYKEFEIVENNSIKWQNILNQEEKSYIIFFYSETCAYCHEMQSEVVDFAITCPLKTYFLDVMENDVPIDSDKKIGVSNYEEASINGTPSILEIENATINANISGIELSIKIRFSKKTYSPSLLGLIVTNSNEAPSFRIALTLPRMSARPFVNMPFISSIFSWERLRESL